MNQLEIMEKLKAPFSPLEIEWRVGSTNRDKTKGLAVAYVTNRAIQNRLDEVFGCFGWENEFKEWRGTSQLCGISVLHEGDWITKWDGADDSNKEATKGGLSDAMKRAAYQWGIGRYLYELPQTWKPITKKGNSYVLTDRPTLPKWALPENVEDKPDEKPQEDKEPKKDNLEEIKRLMNKALKTHGKDVAEECIREYLITNKIPHTSKIPEDKLNEFERYIDDYTSTNLPEDI
jgi:hypothetical protein